MDGCHQKDNQLFCSTQTSRWFLSCALERGKNKLENKKKKTKKKKKLKTITTHTHTHTHKKKIKALPTEYVVVQCFLTRGIRISGHLAPQLLATLSHGVSNDKKKIDERGW